MDPAIIGTRLASSAIGPLVRRLLVQDGPGAGLTDRRIRLSRLVSFRGEKRTLTDRDVRTLAAALVEESMSGGSGASRAERPFPPDETEAVVDALARTLLALGDLDMDDVQAVRLGHRDLARRLRSAGPAPDGLSQDATLYLESVTEWACLHILHFFTQRSTFVARTLVEQSRDQAELIAKVDALITRTPRADARDAEFERRYLAYAAKRHGSLTIYGIDLHHSPDAWPLDVAYLSLEATGTPAEQGSTNKDGKVYAVPGGRPPARLRDIRVLAAARAPLSADQALARHPRVLLRGLAGSGKTTLVQWLAVSATRDKRDGGGGMGYLRDRIPFVLPLRTLTRHGERLPAPDRFLSAVGCPLTAPDGWADRVLTAGRGLILVDGIDEVPEAERDRARRWLRDLLATYDGNRWLVTSRPSAVRDDWLTPDGFAELTLSPMKKAEVTAFVQRWHQAAGPDAQPYEQPLLDALRTSPDLALLATNPLMCGLICALHRDRRGYLPRGRKALYDAALSMLLTRRDRERDMGTPYGVDLGEAPQIQLVQRLAYWLTLNGRTEMDRSHAESIVRAAIPAIPEAAAHADPDALFNHLLHRSGLLRRPGPDTVDFVHRTFQDYLAAKALVDEWHIGVLTDHAADDQWEDVIRMSVAHARPREAADIFRELLAAADAAEDRRTQLRIMVVAATALDHATEVAPEIRRAILDRTAEVIPPRTAEEARELASAGRAVLELLPGPEGLEDEQAEMAVIAASHIKIDAALPYLRRFTEHRSLRVRSQLVWAWSRYETRTYGEEIVARLDPAELEYTITNDEQAEEIQRLGLRPDRLDVRGEVSDGAVTTLLVFCDPVGLNLHRAGERPDLSALTGLGRLEDLMLQLDDDAAWSMEVLPSSLTSIAFPGWPEEGLLGLRDRESLVHLDLTDADLTADRWAEIASLPRLRAFTLQPRDFTFFADGRYMPDIEWLALVTGGTGCILDPVVHAFPGLRVFEIIGPQDAHPLDLAPLAALRRLEQVRTADIPVTGADQLPDSIEVHN
ncbi:NACHT domain-containing protein [Streptomyces purpureus]|uniref:NACHT domain-containing protein n=1 Tax=Streptomyces purpureus TaxID=1951 RepID=UPI00378D00E6